jgi:hypothetical protein
MKSKMLVGSLEKCDLPDLMIEGLHIRVDTGATTSSLHVDNIEVFIENKEEWVSYDIHPDIHDVEKIVTRRSKVVGMRNVKSSSGERERRYVIETSMVLGGEQWDILITLTDRSSMNYLMLLGRQAMNGHVIVDPELEYQLNY